MEEGLAKSSRPDELQRLTGDAGMSAVANSKTNGKRR